MRDFHCEDGENSANKKKCVFDVSFEDTNACKKYLDQKQKALPSEICLYIYQKYIVPTVQSIHRIREQSQKNTCT